MIKNEGATTTDEHSLSAQPHPELSVPELSGLAEKKTNGFALLVNRVFASTALILVALVICLDQASHLANPLKYLAWQRVHPFQLTQASVLYKYSVLMSRQSTPDVLLFGTSMMIAPIYYCDTGICPASKPSLDRMSDLGLNLFQSYPEAIYLSDLLTHALHRHVDVLTMTVPAAMVSDSKLLLSKLIQHGKAPKMVVYGISPRDFIDNLIPPIGGTPTFKALGDLSDLCAIGPAHLAPDIAQNLVVYSLSNYYRVRNDFRVLALEWSSKAFNRPRDLSESVSWQQTEAEHATVRAPVGAPVGAAAGAAVGATANHSKSSPIGSLTRQQQMVDYGLRYNPPNWKRFDQELQQFVDLVHLCQAKHIDLVVVNMPITPENKALIDAKLYARYLDEVTRCTSTQNVRFIDFQDSLPVSKADYLDTVHLNGQGGQKFQDALAPLLAARLRVLTEHAPKTGRP